MRAIGVMWLCATVAGGITPAALGQVDSRDIALELAAADDTPPRRFLMRIQTPGGFDAASDATVVLFSGGISVDIDWTTPGVVATEDGELRLTLDGEPVRTGARIADALLDAGFRVVRYASVPSVPDGADEVVGTPGLSGFAESVDLARLAWARALESCGIEEARAFVVGHSLGAARAALVTERPAGYVTLAGAYLSPRRAPPSRLVRADVAPGPDAVDSDGSGTLDPFEIAASRALAEESYRDDGPFVVQGDTYAWPGDRLIAIGSPVLAVWGSLDPTSYHGPVLERLFADAGAAERLTTVYEPGLGHELGAQEGALIGPIEDRVLERIVAWLRAQSR